MSEIWFRSNGPEGYRFLSNFYPCSVLGFRSAEHAYQVAKFADHDDRVAVALQPSALDAKRVAGQRVSKIRSGFDPRATMREVVRAKFYPGSELERLLLATGDALLVEDNNGPWGGRDNGANWLGLLLMELRAERAMKGEEA